MRYTDFFGGFGGGMPGFMAGFAGFFFLFALWSLVWKGLALWHAARRGEKGWFVALLVINTVGILEIVYLFAIAKINQTSTTVSQTPVEPPKT